MLASVGEDITGLGLLLTAGGLGALYRAWRAPERRIGWILAGWAQIIVALILGPHGGVTDRSVALGLLALPLLAYPLIGFTADRRPPGRAGGTRRPPTPSGTSPRQRPKLWHKPLWRGVWRTALAGPIAALLALAVGTLIVRHGAGSDDDRLVWAELLAPVIWAAAMAWSLADQRLRRVSAGLVLSLLATGMGSLV